MFRARISLAPPHWSATQSTAFLGNCFYRSIAIVRATDTRAKRDDRTSFVCQRIDFQLLFGGESASFSTLGTQAERLPSHAESPKFEYRVLLRPQCRSRLLDVNILGVQGSTLCTSCVKRPYSSPAHAAQFSKLLSRKSCGKFHMQDGVTS
jgi:hypothetical protein